MSLNKLFLAQNNLDWLTYLNELAKGAGISTTMTNDNYKTLALISIAASLAKIAENVNANSPG